MPTSRAQQGEADRLRPWRIDAGRVDFRVEADIVDSGEIRDGDSKRLPGAAGKHDGSSKLVAGDDVEPLHLARISP